MSTINPLGSLPSIRRVEGPASAEIFSELPPYRADPPPLTHPSKMRSEYLLLNVMEGLCDLKTSLAETMTTRLDAMKTATQTLSVQLMQKLKEAAEQVQTCDFWGILKKIATSVLAAFSFAFGTSLIVSGGSALVGGALIASGLITIANSILVECKGWDWITDCLTQDKETKRKLSDLLPTIVGVVACGFGLSGAVYGMATGAIDLSQKAASLAQTVMSLFGATVNAGKGFADTNLAWTQSTLTALEGQNTNQTNAYRLLANSITSIFDSVDAPLQYARKAIQSTKLDLTL